MLPWEIIADIFFSHFNMLYQQNINIPCYLKNTLIIISGVGTESENVR